MKPILFNTEMVRAIMAGHKTVTRRVVKPQPHTECDHGGQHEFIRDDFIDGISFTGFVCKKCGYGVCGPHFKFPVGTSWLRPPYRPGDILYVRETWGDGVTHYLYRADYPDGSTYIPKWRPSIHMPKEAARLFLRVTGVRVERLQDITSAGVSAEGTTGRFGATRGAFEILWDSTIKPADLGTYGWAANPWVWVVEFERITKEEANDTRKTV